jgi:DNA primase
VGPQAVCTLGATLTNEQQTLFRQHFKDYSGVLLFDPDVKDKLALKVNEIEADLNERLKSGFCSVQLPEGTDPGSLARTMLREYITKQAGDKGVIISWKKR